MFVIFSANQTDLVTEPNFVSITFVKVNEEKWLTNYINNQLEFVIRKWSVVDDESLFMSVPPDCTEQPHWLLALGERPRSWFEGLEELPSKQLTWHWNLATPTDLLSKMYGGRKELIDEQQSESRPGRTRHEQGCHFLPKIPSEGICFLGRNDFYNLNTILVLF